MTLNLKEHRYDILIIVTICSLAYGNYELLGALWPVRIIGFLALPICLKHGKLLLNSIFSPWVIFIIIWWLYMMLSLLWTPDITRGIVYAVHMTTMMGCFCLLFLCAIKSKKPIMSMSIGWMLFLMITVPIALWEISTGNHLSSGAFNEGAISGKNYRTFAAVTFMNLNSYVLMLVLSFPFITIPILRKDASNKLKFLSVVMLFLVSIILIINASRTGIIALMVGLVLLSLFKAKNSGRVAKSLIILTAVALFGFILANIEQIALFNQILTRLDGKSSIMEDSGRVSLILNGLEICKNNLFLGSGIMSMNYMYDTYTNSSIIYAHNMVIEMLIEYGILALFFFLLFYKFLFRLRKSDSVILKYLFWFVLIISPFMFIIDDYYQSRAGIWIFMASIISISGVWRKLNLE